jgi:hypothetical protein
MLVLYLLSDNEFTIVADNVPVLGLNVNFDDAAFNDATVPDVAVAKVG